MVCLAKRRCALGRRGRDAWSWSCGNVRVQVALVEACVSVGQLVSMRLLVKRKGGWKHYYKPFEHLWTGAPGPSPPLPSDMDSCMMQHGLEGHSTIHRGWLMSTLGPCRVD